MCTEAPYKNVMEIIFKITIKFFIILSYTYRIRYTKTRTDFSLCILKFIIRWYRYKRAIHKHRVLCAWGLGSLGEIHFRTVGVDIYMSVCLSLVYNSNIYVTLGLGTKITQFFLHSKDQHFYIHPEIFVYS